MTSVAVIAHNGKSLGGGLGALRRALVAAGVDDPTWFEVPKSKKAPKCAREALDGGAELVIVWGGDGMVQHCIDALAGSQVRIGIIPAGTANLLATNLGIPRDIERAVQIALHGHVRKLDVGCLNGERFAVMAGAGWDALMIRDADGALKDRLGRVAYVWAGARHLREEQFRAIIKVDDKRWFEGMASCVLVANIGRIFGGIQVFDGAKADDGQLEIGVITAKGPVQWGRALARTAVGRATKSPFVETTSAAKIRIKFDRAVRYEIDGGARAMIRRLRIDVEPGAIVVCVPEDLPEDAP